jgi:hypothetical protein
MDSIKACLAAGADVFSSDNCKCLCAPDGCLASSVFNLSFESYMWLQNTPDSVWTFEWLSLVEDYRGHEASKRTLLSFFRRVKSDEIGISHVCCHRGRGTNPKHSFYDEPRALLEEDMNGILAEEIDLIEILEQEMGYLALESFDDLRSEWMLLLKERYENHIENIQEKRNKQTCMKRTKRVSDNMG